MGIEVVVEGLTKSFGRRVVWRDVTLALPAGEVSVMIGPSGTGKTVFLKSLIGLIRPERGRVLIDGTDMVRCSERQLYRARRLFGIMFQDGALFGSMNLFDNIAFPLREHTSKSEAEIRRIVGEKMEMVGLAGEERKLPGEISGGMRKRAGLARALVLDPQIILCDEPDSGLDPVRTAYLTQLLIDLNARLDATILTVTHNIDITRTMPDNIGMLFRGDLIMFGPREVLLTSEDPIVTQFVNGRKLGPIGMSEERDAVLAGRGAVPVAPGQQAAALSSGRSADTLVLEPPEHGGGPGARQEGLRVMTDAGAGGESPGTGTGGPLPGTGIGAGTPGAGTGDGPLGIVPQLEPSPGLPPRLAVQRRKDRVMSMLHTLPPAAQRAILDSLSPADRARYGASVAGAGGRSAHPAGGGSPGQAGAGDVTEATPRSLPPLPSRHPSSAAPAQPAPGGWPLVVPGGQPPATPGRPERLEGPTGTAGRPEGSENTEGPAGPQATPGGPAPAGPQGTEAPGGEGRS